MIKVLEGSSHCHSLRDDLNEFYHPFVAHYNPNLLYSQPVELFLDITNSIVGDSYSIDFVWDSSNTQQFFDAVSDHKDDAEIELERDAYEFHDSQNQKRLMHYVNHTIVRHPEIMLIGIVLSYKAETRHHLNIELFNYHINTLRSLIYEEETCFAHLHGHAWNVIQRSDYYGLNCNLVLMYDCSIPDSDHCLSQEIGRKWIEITAGLGEHYSYNNTQDKAMNERYMDTHLGLISNDNPELVAKTLLTVSELMYDSDIRDEELQLDLKLWLPNMETFGHGMYRTKKRRGLPK